MKRIATWATAIAALAFFAPVSAHHSTMMFDLSMPVWVKGTVVHYDAVNPHVLIALEERSADGQVRRRTVEGPILARLDRMSFDARLLKVGDVIEVCGFAYKQEWSTKLPRLHTDGAALPQIHGHVLVMSDGRMRPWGPYGKLENCIRPNDQTRSWLELIDTNPMAREYWCNSRKMAQIPSIASKAFVDEIDRRMAKPCG